VSLGDCYHLVSVGDWRDLSGACQGVCGSPGDQTCTRLELHLAGDGERRLLVRSLVLVTWEWLHPWWVPQRGRRKVLVILPNHGINHRVFVSSREFAYSSSPFYTYEFHISQVYYSLECIGCLHRELGF